jgi:DNA-binding NarL/FixJ family response regulator
MGVIEDLARAHEAYERREWQSAYRALSAVDDAEFAAADFLELASSAWLAGRENDGVQAAQRAYQAYVDAGDVPGAVRAACLLAMNLLMAGEAAIGSGWVARAQRLLEGRDDDSVEHGYVLMLVMFRSIFTGDYAAALEVADRVTEYGRRFGDLDLHANGLNAQGRMLIYAGRVREGFALLDEAMVAVTMGEVDPLFAGEIYCSLIEACQEISDYGRAAEWTGRLARWVEDQPELVRFTGQCAVHRGQIMRLRGAFTDAVGEFEHAVDRYLASGQPAPAGLACAEQGDVLRILGDFAGSQASYDRAVGFGHEPQPGLALLWLTLGRGDTATAAMRRLLGERGDPVGRSQILAAAVEVLLEAGEVEVAAGLAAEFTELAADFGCVPLQATAGTAAGSVLLAKDSYAEALSVLRPALQTWLTLEATYHVARTRLLIARCLRGLDDEESAIRELTEAGAAFRGLGAAPDARAADQLLGRSAPAGLTDREVEVLRLVATGKSNPEIAAVLVLSEKTVARHLSNIFTKLDVTSRTAAAAYAFENRLV